MRAPLYYILNAAGEPVPVEFYVWAEWFETAERHVAHDADEQSGWRVSTVFLGLDHQHLDDGPPLLFETLVFGGPLDGQMQRYPTRAAAEAGHREICARVAALLGEIPIDWRNLPDEKAES